MLDFDTYVDKYVYFNNDKINKKLFFIVNRNICIDIFNSKSFSMLFALVRFAFS